MVGEFIRRQRAAALRIIRGLARIGETKEQFTRTTQESVAKVVAAPSRAERARIAARAVGPALANVEAALEEQAPELLAAIAELSENWEEHQALWDSLQPADLPQVIEAEEAVSELREALVRARDSDRVFRESVQQFASLGPEATEVSRGVISRLTGIMSALDEYRSQADEVLATLRKAQGK